MELLRIVISVSMFSILMPFCIAMLVTMSSGLSAYSTKSDGELLKIFLYIYEPLTILGFLFSALQIYYTYFKI